MAEIEFRTLGGLDITRDDGQQLHSLLAQPKRVALLAYLCIATPRGFHRRDSLVAMFWPEADQSHARTSLRNALHVLRRAMGEDILDVRGDEEVAIDFGKLRCDALEFEKHVNADHVDDALTLYGGDLLPAFFIDDSPAFERWLDGERVRLKGLAARAARSAAEKREKENRITEAISLARRAAELTENDERSVRKLIELLARLGDRAGAFEAYEKFRRFLRDDLDAEPSSETRALIERLRAENDAPTHERNINQPIEKPMLSGLPGYSIEGELGRGGMATVLLAHDLKHDRKVAIKVMRRDIASLLGTERFLAEIGIAAKLSHPNIVPVHDSGEHDGVVYYVMPHVEGETLRARLNREGALPLDDAIRIVTRLGSALDFAHRRGVIHRDIKPENIMLCEGEPMLLDFGIARAISAAGGSALTQTGITVGTPAYLSPEQASGETRLDGRTDQYSLACTFYEMVAGRAPFTATTPERVIGMRFAGKPPDLSRRVAGISASVAAATSRALSIDPSDRFSTLQEFSDALKRKRSPLSWRLRFLSSRAALTLSGVALLGILAMAAWARRGESRIDESPVTLTKKSYVTNTGRVAQAAISPNGQTLAYVDVSCTMRACTYGVEMKDVDGASSRRVLDDVNELFGPGITWSPDGRNILLRGRINKKRGTILVSALGNVVRRVGPEMYSFWSGGDSLVFARRDSNSVHLIFSGLDGAPVDSLVTTVHEEDAGVQVVPFPNSRWFAVRLPGRSGALWFSVDRQGRIGSRLPRTLTLYPRTSSDALWLAVPELTTDLVSIVRIPFDSATGRFGEHRDTVHTGSVSTMDVTSDGTKIAINETTAEFTGWALEMRDLAKGVLPQNGPLVTATSHLTFEISPNGRRILVGRRAGSAATGSLKWELIPFSGGTPIPLSGAPSGSSSLFWADSSNIGVWTSTPSGGVSLGVLSVETGQRHNEYSMSDSGWVEAVPLVGGGWAWNSLRSAVKVYRPGSREVRTFSLPPNYPRIQSLAPSPYGQTVAFTTQGAYRDSVRLSVISLTTGGVSQVFAVYGGGPSFAVWLRDGSILFSTWENPDGGAAMYRVRPTGELVSVTRVPVRMWAGSVSSDMKRATLVMRNYRGDVTLSNVTRR